MRYAIVRNEKYINGCAIHLNHQLVAVDRTKEEYTRETNRDECPPLVNDLFDHIQALTSIVLKCGRLIFFHNKSYDPNGVVQQVLQVLQLNLETGSTLIDMSRPDDSRACTLTQDFDAIVKTATRPRPKRLTHIIYTDIKKDTD